MSRNSIGSLPKDFKRYFWDCSFSALNLKDYSKFILGRLLHYGDMKSILWVYRNYSKKEIKEYLIRTGKRELDHRSYVFWSKLITIK